VTISFFQFDLNVTALHAIVTKWNLIFSPPLPFIRDEIINSSCLKSRIT